MDCRVVAQDAAKYLILQQNRLQDAFEFTVFNIDDFMRATNRKDQIRGPRISEIDCDEYLGWAEVRVQEIRAWIPKYISNNELEVDSSMATKWVVFTEAAFKDDYYSNASDDVAVVSVARWKRFMAPPSVVEFILRMTQAYCAEFFLGLREHYATRGCLLDFNQYIEDAKLMTLIGTLCTSCQVNAQRRLGWRQSEVDALQILMDRHWVGDTSTSGSVASILKKVYNYDLFISKGLSTSAVEKFVENLRTSSTQEFVRLIAAVVLAYLLLKFGLRAQ